MSARPAARTTKPRSQTQTPRDLRNWIRSPGLASAPDSYALIQLILVPLFIAGDSVTPSSDSMMSKIELVGRDFPDNFDMDAIMQPNPSRWRHVMDDRLNKTERLIKIWLLLLNSPFRFTTKNLAERFGVNVRTIYRDLVSLDADLRVPVREEHTRWGIDEGYFLPPIRFTVPEALSLFLAARLMLSYSHRYDPNADATFTKLSSVVPPALREQIQKTIDWMQGLPRNDSHLRTLARLAEAWVSQHRVRIAYRSLPAESATERIVEPYFIEPAASGHASYLIAYCHRTQSIRIFKIERIEAIESLPETYTVPSDFDANAYLGSSWGIVVEGEVKTIRLRIARELARLMEETVWHPSQRVERQADGSALMTLEVADTVEFYSWVLGWADGVEVLSPDDVRTTVMEKAKATLAVYRNRQRFWHGGVSQRLFNMNGDGRRGEHR